MYFHRIISQIGSLVLLITAVSAIAIPGYGLTSNGKHFATQNGSHFFWQADTAWGMFHRWTLNETAIYLDDRASKGFNMILSVGFTQFGISTPNREGDLPFINENPVDWNEPYWQKIDKVVEMAWERGMRVALIPAWGKYIHGSDDTGSYINASNARTFGALIGARYPGLPKVLVADTNPWWQNKTAVKDDFAVGGVPPTYEFTNWLPLYDDLAEGIVAGEKATSPESTPMITIHCTNLWFTGGPIAIASQQAAGRSWLTFDSSQSGHTDFAPDPPMPWWNARRGWEPIEHMYAGASDMPLVDNEAHYEGRYYNGNANYTTWTAQDVRIGSWQAVLSGASGLTYGHDMVMQAYVPDVYTPDGSGPAVPWDTALLSPGSREMQFIQKVVKDRARPFERVPAQDVLTSPAGGDDQRVVAARDASGSWIIVYTPTGQPFDVDMSVMQKTSSKSVTASSKSSSTIRSSWYDPLSGVYTVISKNLTVGAGSTTFTPPANATHPDWALVLEVIS